MPKMGRKRKRHIEDDYDQVTSFLEESETKPSLERNAANERERARMRVLSCAFQKLKTSLPWVPPDTKLSKLDTLRLASCYIAHLSRLLSEEEGEDVLRSSSEKTGQFVKSLTATLRSNENFRSTTKLTWPFNLPTTRTLQIDSCFEVRAPRKTRGMPSQETSM